MVFSQTVTIRAVLAQGSVDDAMYPYRPISIDSDRDSIFDVWSREEELCRNYMCCGYDLPELHALIDHFQEHHIVVLYPAPLPSPDNSLTSSPLSSPSPTTSLAAAPPYATSSQPSSSAYCPSLCDPTPLPLSCDCSSPVSALRTIAVHLLREGISTSPPVQPQLRTLPLATGPPMEAAQVSRKYAQGRISKASSSTASRTSTTLSHTVSSSSTVMQRGVEQRLHPFGITMPTFNTASKG
ncbi:hypothetical protein FA95DRAFT_1611867 [Auriscalpium vulgare]|uniref:Uncharacterized protein n=1 Tax=Auriscalpium vulgare TaxID=40419 RepID=A0ACB8R8X3_9AGAM|nr:hypothetical protein FA95DRAFT_1611867 [Auriscalpium vulgare]